MFIDCMLCRCDVTHHAPNQLGFLYFCQRRNQEAVQWSTYISILWTIKKSLILSYYRYSWWGPEGKVSLSDVRWHETDCELLFAACLSVVMDDQMAVFTWVHICTTHCKLFYSQPISEVRQQPCCFYVILFRGQKWKVGTRIRRLLTEPLLH